MDKTYDPKRIEAHWQAHWVESKLGQPTGDGEPYTITCPPPNVTGHLHMGHGFQLTLMDALIRYHRMCGRKTLWQAGTDHAGIATQMVVERQLLKEGKSRHDLGREAFIERIWDWKKISHQHITQQMKRMGASLDWDSECFTMDPEISKAVEHTFVRLYKEGLIYRGKKLVNWDPALQTAISDLEIKNVEQDGQLYHLRYPFEDGSGHLVVATTRPETLFGDQAIAVHPEDARYRDRIGQRVLLPLTDRTLPIIADEYVDPEFGTGCVKITPAHDFNDYEVGQRHDLPLLNILEKNGCLNDVVPKPFCGRPGLEARSDLIDALKALDLIEDIVPYRHMVPCGDRSGVPLEPYLTDQWFMKMKDLAQPAMDAVTEGQLGFIPDHWHNTYNRWLEDIQDWCLSRQLWWGHRIPAWYDETGQVYVGIDETTIRSEYNLDKEVTLTQDPDVLDTWFSSALWPFTTLGWPQESERLKTFYPTQVLVTGFDIIFFWVARMVMMGLKLTDQSPFSKVVTTGLIRDGFGEKMSKSKGNVIDPIDLIDGISLEDLLVKRTHGLMQPDLAHQIKQRTQKEYPEGIPAHGTDALRMTFCALASTGRDIRFDASRLMGYRNFCNKIWNASRFVLHATEMIRPWQDAYAQSHPINTWMISTLQTIIEEVHQHFAAHRFDLLAQTLYEAIWHTFCDWYLELSKPLLQMEAYQEATEATLLHTLTVLLKLCHPVIPFISAELYQSLSLRAGLTEKDCARTVFPQANPDLMDAKTTEDILWLQTIISGARTMRAELNLPPNQAIPLLFQGAKDRLEPYLPWVERLVKTTSMQWQEGSLPPSATTQIETLMIAIPLEGLIDPAEEMKRISKVLKKLDQDLNAASARLGNPTYRDKAPKEVVEALEMQTQVWQKESKRLSEYTKQLKQMVK